jgi:hypothetical protein
VVTPRLVFPDADIATGVAGMCVNERGRLLEHSMLDWSMRGALLADLARAGMLTLEGDSPSIGPPPGGFPPLDVAAYQLAEGPSLDAWIRTGRLGVRDVVEALVADGAWRQCRRGLTRRRRFDTGKPRDRWGRTPERRLLQPLVGLPTDPALAMVLLLTWAAGLSYEYQPVDDLLIRSGSLRWVADLAWGVIGDERDKRRREATAARMGKMFGPG